MTTTPASFTCSHCGHSQRGEIITGGKSDFLLQFASCPSCKQRGSRRAYVQRGVLVYLGFCAILFIASLRHPHAMQPTTQLIVDVVLLALMASGATRAWRRLDDRVRWLDA